jgi:hypothetical protein
VLIARWVLVLNKLRLDRVDLSSLSFWTFELKKFEVSERRQKTLGERKISNPGIKSFKILKTLGLVVPFRF